MAKKTEIVKPVQEEKKLDVIVESLTLGHLIKYNLYLLAKTNVFSAILNNKKLSVDDAITETNRVLIELDAESKKDN